MFCLLSSVLAICCGVNHDAQDVICPEIWVIPKQLFQTEPSGKSCVGLVVCCLGFEDAELCVRAFFYSPTGACTHTHAQLCIFLIRWLVQEWRGLTAATAADDSVQFLE